LPRPPTSSPTSRHGRGRGQAANARRAASTIEPLRTRILAAARRLCFAEGVDAASARKIAAEVGVSATAIYLHFESIEHLLHEIRMEGHALLTEYLRRPDARMNAIERICAMGVEYYHFGLEQPQYFALMFGRVDRGQLGRLVATEGASLDVVREAAKIGIERGDIRAELDPLVIANVAWMSIHGLTSMVVSGHAAVTAPKLEAQLLEGLMQSMTAWLRPT
jgi:AcrR family transcriptional regulator